MCIIDVIMLTYYKGEGMNYFVKKYKGIKPVFRGGDTNYNSIEATVKYVEYCLDIIDINKLLLVETDFDTKWDLRYCLERAESKRDWHVKHPNFETGRAAILMGTVRNLPRKHMEQAHKEKFKK